MGHLDRVEDLLNAILPTCFKTLDVFLIAAFASHQDLTSQNFPSSDLFVYLFTYYLCSNG